MILTAGIDEREFHLFLHKGGKFKFARPRRTSAGDTYMKLGWLLIGWW